MFMSVWTGRRLLAIIGDRAPSAGLTPLRSPREPGKWRQEDEVLQEQHEGGTADALAIFDHLSELTPGDAGVLHAQLGVLGAQGMLGKVDVVGRGRPLRFHETLRDGANVNFVAGSGYFAASSL